MKKLIILLMLMLPMALVAESFDPEILNDKVYLGDEISIKIAAVPSERISAAFAKDFADAAIRGTEPTPEKDAVIIRIVPFVSGETEMPEIILSNGGKTDSVNSFKVDISARTQDEDTELRGLKDNAEIREKDFTLLWIIGALVLLGILAFVFVKLKKKFKKTVVETVPEAVPADVARKFIAEAEEMRKKGDFESFTDLVTLGLKTYISLKSKTNYTEMTTSEVKRALKKDPLFSGDSQTILDILKLGDRYKFADDALMPEDFDSLINGFRDFLDKKEVAK